MKNDLGKTWYYRAGQNIGHPILLAHPTGYAKKRGTQNRSQCACLIEKELETIIFVLLPK